MTQSLVQCLAEVRPSNRVELRGWLRAALALSVPDRAHCSTHASPMDYLEHVYFEREPDPIVWANRGGGKTFYGAVATLLDLLFKPGISICILGGSFDQSQRMYEYLCDLIDRPGLRDQISGKITQRGVRLRNGSRVELSAASNTSIRGRRVQKLRCDEVDLFKPEYWLAAQYVTRSKQCGSIAVRGSVEVFSTMHRPFGLMCKLVDQAAASQSWRVIPWCALDVVARCEPWRECEWCTLAGDCAGQAKTAGGFLDVADVLAQQARSSQASFESEMLCRRPSVNDLVFPAFDPTRHVRPLEADPALKWVGGMDFGLRNPFVMLWIQLRSMANGLRLEVIDEYVESERTVDQHISVISARDWPKPAWVGVDPAGAARNEQTGASNIELLQRAGYSVRRRGSRIEPGIELLRRYIDPADGSAGPGLLIHPRCERLIRSLQAYHFDPDQPQKTVPVKDGNDHAIDALRYMAINLERGSSKVRSRGY